MNLVLGGLGEALLVVGGLGGIGGPAPAPARPANLVVGGLGTPLLATDGLGGWPGPPPLVAQTFRQALRAKLLSLVDLAAIVGRSVYPGGLPPTHDLARDGPALTYDVAKNTLRTARAFGHVLTGSDGTVDALVKLTAESYTFADVDAISLILYERLDGVRNATDWGDGTNVVMSCLHGPEQDQSGPAPVGRPGLIYRITVEFWVRYRANPIPDNS